ncbi:MAG: hypothetical protein AAGI03_16885 [Pseudomonadota bacterium]
MDTQTVLRAGLLTAALSLVSAGAFAQVGNNQKLLNPNLASESELAALPNVSEELAKQIVAGRPFLRGDDLHALVAADLSEAQLEELYGVMFLPLNLNTASRAVIMRVAGMSRKMAHEFEEYRPYTSIEQFRREMGKYVDDAEVARLEQYVFVPMNLNESSDDHFKTIPGMSRKMVHEFEEYQPYADMGEFRREIGKYVDEAEVARLERYVTLD